MNTQFHTPSLGDETFDFSGIETATTNPNEILENNNFQQTQQEYIGSKRMQNMEKSMPVSDVVNISDYNNLNGVGGSNIHVANLNNNMLNTTTTNSTILPTTTTLAARKQLAPDVDDPNEPLKPLSTFSYFFRDTVSIIKQQNPNCEFKELSSIVQTMWEALDPAQKEFYHKKTEAARNEYVKQKSIYLQQQRLQQQQQQQQLQKKNIDTQKNVNANTNSNLNPNQAISATVKTLQPQMVSQQQAAKVVGSGAVNTTPSTSSATASEGAAAPTQTNASNPTQSQSNAVAQRINAQEASEQAQVEGAQQAANELQLCVREGCRRRAVVNPDWEDEYCSNECVVIHCRSVFNSWVQQNKEAAEAAAASLQ